MIDEYYIGQDGFEYAVFRRDNGDIRGFLLDQRDALLRVASNVQNIERPEFNAPSLYHNLVVRAATEVERMEQWLNEPVEMLAWCARNLLEVDLSLRYALLAGGNLQRWFAQTYRDEIDLLEGIMSLDVGPVNANALSAQVQQLPDTLKQSFGGVKQMPVTLDIAKVVNQEKAYCAFYKLYSKYVHPSSWLVNEAKVEGVDSPLHKGIFLIQGYRHAANIYDRIEILT